MGTQGLQIQSRRTFAALVRRWPSDAAVALAAWLCIVAFMVDDPPAIYDQAYLFRASWFGPWPAPQFGALSEAAAATAELVAPAGWENFVLRAGAAATLLMATFLVARRVLASPAQTTAVVVLVALSPLPRLLTSEVLLTSVLLMAVWAAVERRRWVVGAACLAMVLAKPDGAAFAVVFLAGYSWWQRDWQPVAAFVVGGVVTMLPGTLWAEDYWGYDGKPARSWVAFGQHFAATVGVDLLPDGPMPWGLRAWHFYTDRLLPDADGVADVVLHHPRMYGRFLVASVREGIPSVGVAFGPLVAVAGAVVASWRRLPEVAKITLVAFAVGVAPHWLVTYPTARHLARWYPLAVVAAVWLWSRAEGRERLMLGGLIVMSGVWSAGLLSV